MDLFCCAKRTRRSQRKSLFPEHRSFGSTASALLERPENSWEDEEDEAGASPESGHPRVSPNTDALHQNGARSSSSSDADDNRKVSIPIPIFTGKLDPFLVDGLPDNGQVATTLKRFKQLAEQIRSEVRVLRRPSRSRMYASLLPENPSRMLRLELLPGNGAGMEPWVYSEVTISDPDEALSSEADIPGKQPLVAARLTRILKVKQIEKHDGGRSMKIKFKHPDRQEACEEFLEHQSADNARACTEALVECIDLVRALEGKSVYSPTGGCSPAGGS